MASLFKGFAIAGVLWAAFGAGASDLKIELNPSSNGSYVRSVNGVMR